MKFKTSVILIICTIFSSLALADQPLEIGVIVALSGDGAGLGQSLKNGIEMGLKELSADDRAKLHFSFEDDGMVQKNTISAFHKLKSIKRLDSIITFSSGTSNALVSLTERNRIPLLALASDSKVSRDKSFAFNFWVTPQTEAVVLVEEIKRRGYKAIARISTTHDGTFAINRAFDQENNGVVSILLDEDFPIEVKDFRPYLNKLRFKKGLDAIFINLLPGQCGLFAKQAREMGFKVPFFDIEIFEDPSEVKNSNGALVGQWYVNSDEAEILFQERYKKTYPGASPNASAHGYDLVNLLLDAKNKGYSREKLADYFHTLKDFKGALGTYSASGDNRFTLPATVKIVTETGFEKYVEKTQ